ncbi:MAG: hypothetical protein ACREOR_09730 [Candidatus Binatia bacterium]
MEQKIFALIGGDAGAQQRYFDTFRRSEYLEPERALLLALLEDAIHCYRKFATARSRSGREQFREIEEWLMGGGNGWVFSFDNVCELLGLDPEYVRRGVRASAASAMEHEGPGRRRHARHRQAA